MSPADNIDHIKRFRDAVGNPIKEFLGDSPATIFYAPMVSDYAAGLTVYLTSNGYNVSQHSISRGPGGIRGFRQPSVRHRKAVFLDTRYDAAAVASIKEWVDYLKTGDESANGLLGALYVSVFQEPIIEVIYDKKQTLTATDYASQKSVQS